MMASIDHAKHIQNEIWQQAVLLIPQNTNQVSPSFVQAVGAMSDMIDQRLAAAEKHIPDCHMGGPHHDIGADLLRCGLQHATQSAAGHAGLAADGCDRTFAGL